jgi:hypothetical protein
MHAIVVERKDTVHQSVTAKTRSQKFSGTSTRYKNKRQQKSSSSMYKWTPMNHHQQQVRQLEVHQHGVEHTSY